jgi:hypothetical protein
MKLHLHHDSALPAILALLAWTAAVATLLYLALITDH